MTHAFDMAIVGGGPAGSATALAGAQLGLSVALFEAQQTLSDKPCGEGLMPAGVDALRELGLDDLASAGRPFGALRYVVPGVAPIEIPLPRPGLAIDRPQLTRGLSAALGRATNVTNFVGHVNVERPGHGDMAGEFRVVSRELSIRARVLVAADGLHGKCASWLRSTPPAAGRAGARRRGARIGVRARFEASRPLDAIEIHFGKGVEIYLTPLPDDRLNVAVLVSRDNDAHGGAEAILARALAEHPLAAGRLAGRVTAPEARALGSPSPRRVALERAFLVGDAGGGIDPILGCGMTLALESGILAARAAAEIVGGDLSGAPEKRYGLEYRRRTQMRRAVASLLLALASRPFLARRTVGLARLTPGILESLVSIAANGPGPRAFHRAAG